MAVTVKIFRLSFHVFACAFTTVISSIFGKSFPFFCVITIFIIIIVIVIDHIIGQVVTLITNHEVTSSIPSISTVLKMDLICNNYSPKLANKSLILSNIYKIIKTEHVIIS